MKTLKRCSLLAAAMLTPVFGAGERHPDDDAAKKTRGKPLAAREAPKAKAKPKSACGSAQSKGRKKPPPAAQCPAKAKNTAKQSDEQLKKALDEAQRKLAKTKAMHEESEKGWNRLQASLKDLRGKASAKERELSQLRKSLAEAEKKAVVIKKKHEEVHRAQAKTEHAMKDIQKELKRRATIAKLEAEAAALQRKAEELRKQAEKLKN